MDDHYRMEFEYLTYLQSEDYCQRTFEVSYCPEGSNTSCDASNSMGYLAETYVNGPPGCGAKSRITHM